MAASKESTHQDAKPVDPERRSPNRTRDDADWESKVLGRVSGRLKTLQNQTENDQTNAGWESSVLDALRRKIERGPV
jgi:hypothetical protein